MLVEYWKIGDPKEEIARVERESSPAIGTYLVVDDEDPAGAPIKRVFKVGGIEEHLKSGADVDPTDFGSESTVTASHAIERVIVSVEECHFTSKPAESKGKK
jgi:hypothetical protein